MITEKELINHLGIIHDLLKKERAALVHNDVVTISEITEKKNEEIEKLKDYDMMGFRKQEEVIDLIKKINSMQELNLLLTQQALSYQNTIIESISKSIKDLSNTYSANGKYEKTKNVNFVDHSI